MSYYQMAVRPDELYHTGVLKMKWGVRRYQNKDGSLTPLGRIHYGVKGAKEIAKQSLDKSIKTGKGNENKSPAEKISGDVNRAVNDASRFTKKLGDNARKAAGKTKDQDVSQMSDEELRRVINRINLERQYKQVTTEEIKTGFDKVSDVLEVVGGVTGIVASIAGIATAVAALKKKEK